MSVITESRPSGAGRPMPDVPGVTHQYVTVRGARFHVAAAGHGEPVVLVHGVAQHWYAWRRVVAELAGRYRVYCVDLRGCGWSSGTPRGYSTADQARDVLGVLDALGVGQVRLIGHDNGGWIGFTVCRLAPERITAFLALNTTHPWPDRARLARNAWRLWHTALWEYPGPGRLVLRHWPGLTRFLLRRWAGPGYRWDPDALAEFVAASRTRDASRAFEQTYWQYVLRDIPAFVFRRGGRWRLTIPTLLLCGDTDVVSRAEVGADLAAHADRLDVAHVPGGHLLPETAPRAVAAAARDLFG